MIEQYRIDSDDEINEYLDSLVEKNAPFEIPEHLFLEPKWRAQYLEIAEKRGLYKP